MLGYKIHRTLKIYYYLYKVFTVLLKQSIEIFTYAQTLCAQVQLVLKAYRVQLVQLGRQGHKGHKESKAPEARLVLQGQPVVLEVKGQQVQPVCRVTLDQQVKAKVKIPRKTFKILFNSLIFHDLL